MLQNDLAQNTGYRSPSRLHYILVQIMLYNLALNFAFFVQKYNNIIVYLLDGDCNTGYQSGR